MKFTDFNLKSELNKAIESAGFTEPSPVQKDAIPEVLKGKDIVAQAQTGTGKTAGFTLPMLEILSTRNIRKRKNQVRALVITPTRELAAQVYENVALYSKYLPLTSAVIFGGVSINPQKAKLKDGLDILVATPGRLLDLIGQGSCDLSQVEFLVLDEADRMLDMGFVKEIRKIHPVLPKKHQTLLFSATFSDKVRKLSKLILNKPSFIETSKKNSTVDTINQVAYMVDTDKKASLCAYLIGSRNFEQVLVFTKTKLSADFLVDELKKDGLKVGVIHGDKTKANRLKTLTQFREKKIKVLVATDIASRGLDIEELPYVINYELPSVPEDYVHRVGRTGRAGREGEAISLVDIYEKYDIKDIERVIGQKIPKEIVEGFEPDPNIRRKDVDEVKLKSEHKQSEKKRVVKKRYKKTTSTKKRKTTKRDAK